MTKRRAGFTLVEVVVTLLIAGIAVLLAGRIFNATESGVRAVRAHRIDLDRRGNAHRWLASAFLSLEVGTPGARAFEGTPERMTFSARVPAEAGWPERRVLAIGSEQGRLTVQLDSGMAVVLAHQTRAEFDYLLEPGADSRWVGTWSSPVSAPLAVRVRLTHRGRVDTALYLIKGRG